MSIEPIIRIFEIIQEIDYFVGTVYRISNSKISGIKSHIPNQGILQGNREGLVS